MNTNSTCEMSKKSGMNKDGESVYGFSHHQGVSGYFDHLEMSHDGSGTEVCAALLERLAVAPMVD